MIKLTLILFLLFEEKKERKKNNHHQILVSIFYLYPSFFSEQIFVHNSLIIIKLIVIKESDLIKCYDKNYLNNEKKIILLTKKFYEGYPFPSIELFQKKLIENAKRSASSCKFIEIRKYKDTSGYERIYYKKKCTTWLIKNSSYVRF